MTCDTVRWIKNSKKCCLACRKKQIFNNNDNSSSLVNECYCEINLVTRKNDSILNSKKILMNLSILPAISSVATNTFNNLSIKTPSLFNKFNRISDTAYDNVIYNHNRQSKNKNLSRKLSKNYINPMKNSSAILVIIMSTLIKFRNRFRTLFSILPIIIVIFQINFLFSDFIVSVVATSDNNVYNSFDYARIDSSKYYDGGHYTSTWAVHIPNGNDKLANEIATQSNFENLGLIFKDHYHFRHKHVKKRSIEPSSHHEISLKQDKRVRWFQQQRVKSRRKRDFIRMRPSRTSSKAVSLVDIMQLNDPKWPQMWYLNRGGSLDMNVIPAWKEGIIGKGIVVTILDDGLEYDHPDLEHNYDPKASYDVNSHDEDPMPHYDMTDSNRHGTRCAGEVAATANNSLCAVGIAFGAKVGGVRMLDGDVTDAVEARSLSLNPQHIDIYSASWGPDDDGKTVDGPGELASRAFIEGVTKGRNGKGSIFIWASGNGGRELDNCNCDGYTNSIWTLSISSATEEGHVPWYSEKCSSTLATTYSSGGQSERQVVTTDLHHSCTASHTGTSASAPLAAGIAALVLQANQNLTWRDLQHIVVRTAKPGNLKDPTWSKNGIGRRISHSFGYGLMDAAAMVRLARTWKTVPEQQRCEINAPHVDKIIPAKSYITLQLMVKHCMGVNFLEHVQAKITLTSPRRGDIQIYLKSPAGTRSTLLTSRMHDVSRSGFNQWPFMSVHTWGEAPHGSWQLEIHNEGRYVAQITQWDLIFYGTEKPAQPDDAIKISPGRYNAYGEQIDHNILDFESETASEQWRSLQQVGESHVDIQHMNSNDQTSAACSTYAPDQRCIDCHQTTFLYNGRCYTVCPNGTYIIPKISDNLPKLYTLEPIMTSNKYIDTFIEADNNLNLKEHRKRRDELNSINKKQCANCDSSCFQCRGPNASDCTMCRSGYQLRKIHETKMSCYYLSERSYGSQINYNFGTHKVLYTFLIIFIPTISMIAYVILMTIYGEKFKSACCCKKDNHIYVRITFDGENEKDALKIAVKKIADVEKSLISNVDNNSDDDG